MRLSGAKIDARWSSCPPLGSAGISTGALSCLAIASALQRPRAVRKVLELRERARALDGAELLSGEHLA